MDSVSCSITVIWQRCCDLLQKKLNPSVFSMWFGPDSATPLSLDEREFVLGLPPNSFIAWAENYRPIVAEALQEVTGRAIAVRFRESEELRPKRVEEPAAAKPVEAAPCAKAVSEPALLQRLNRSYSFESFVVGANNRFAFNACEAAAQHPGGSYNPLFLHGASGLGKTHLLQSIAREVLAHNPKAVVEYLTSEQFGNLFIESVTSHGKEAMAKFRQRFRNVDVLLLDDVQFFSGKTAMQEEFFHTFNTLYEEHRQIVLTSDRMPQELSGLEDRLVSRFSGGLTVDITPPDLDMRVAILQSKQSGQELQFSEEVLRYLASRIKSNVRNLESSLLTLRVYLAMPPVVDPRNVTRAQIDKILGSRFETEAAEQLTVARILEFVAHYFDVRIQDLKGKSRLKELTVPRQIAMFLARQLTDKSLPAIAESFNKSHPTVLHSIDIIRSRMEKSEEFRQEVASIQHQLQE